MDPNETSFFLQAALFALAGFAGYLCISTLRVSVLRSASIVIGLLPGMVVVGGIAAVRVSDGGPAGALGLVALLLIGFSICTGVLLAWRLIGQPTNRPGHNNDR